MASTHRLQAAIGGALLVAVLATTGAGTASAAEPNKTLTVTPTTIAKGTAFTVSGKDCFGDEVIIAIDGAGEIATADPASNGTWSVSVPTQANDDPGTYDLVASCEDYYDSFAYNVVEITIVDPAPVVTITAPGTTGTPSVRAGGTLTLAATGFQPAETVVATLRSNPVVVGTFVADASGKVSASINIPANTTLGAHTIQFVGNVSQRNGSIAITVVAAGSGLPVSGSSAGRDLAAGLAVVLIGLVLLGQSSQLPLRRTA